MFVFFILCLNLVFGDFSLSNEEKVDELGIASVYPILSKLDKQSVSIWYLHGRYPAKWDRVKDDEFEFEDALNEAYEQLKKESKELYDHYKKETGVLNLNAKFKKYDFSNQCFPLEVMDKNSFVDFYGHRMVNNAKLIFNNTNPKGYCLPMDKKTAKGFVKSRKHDNWFGDKIDRRVTARYYYKIDKIKIDEGRLNSNRPSSIYTPNIAINGKIEKLEIIDPYTKKILAIYHNKKQ